MKQRISIIVNQGKKYLRIVKWLLRDAYFTKIWGKPARVFVYAGLRLACQAGGVTILYFYANALKSGNTIDFLHFSLPARESFMLMWITIISSLLLFTLASVFQYFSRIAAISLASAFEESSSRSAFSVVSRLPDPRVPEINELLKNDKLRRIPGDARKTGMAVRSIGFAVPQVISGLVATVAIILIDPTLTLILGVFMAFIFILQYPANIKGAKHSLALEKNVSLSGKGNAAIMRSFLLASQEKEIHAAAIDDLYARQGLKAAIQAFAGRIRVLEESTLIMQVGSAFGISIVVFYIGSRLLGGIENWGLLLAYIASLRMVLNGVVQVARTLTSFSRFYPQLVRSHTLFSAQRLLDSSGPALTAGERLLIVTNGQAGSQIDLALPGRVALYTPDRIDRSLFHLFNYAKVIDHSGEERAFGNSSHLTRYDETPDEAARQFNVGDASASDVLFVDSEAISSMPANLSKTILDSVIVLTVYTDLQQPPVNGESIMLIWFENQVQGIIDLSKEGFESVTMEMENLFNHRKQVRLSERMAEDEEEDDDF